MAGSTLYLLADTNLFFECKRLEEIPWDEFGVDRIEVLLARPVLDEIDKHKKSNGRTRDRAVEIWSRIRSLIGDRNSDEIVIQEDAPQVVVKRVGNVRPDPQVIGDLDTSKADDRLIGILSTLTKDRPSDDICLLSHDTGPITTAEDFGLSFHIIPDGWLRPRREAPEAKQIRELKSQLNVYRSQEPEFEISVDGVSPSSVLTQLQEQYEPLSEAEIAALLERLKDRAAMATDFSERSLKMLGPFHNLRYVGRKTTFVPPSEEEIRRYQEVDYPAWLENCRTILDLPLFSGPLVNRVCSPFVCHHSAA